MTDGSNRATVREIVGLNIATLRTSAGLSQGALGNRLEQWLEASWSRQAVSLAEQGKRAFGVDDLVGLSVGLHATVRQLLAPAPTIDTVILASGTEVPARAYQDTVLGGSHETEEVQRSQIVGRLNELQILAEVIAERRDALRKHLQALGEERTRVNVDDVQQEDANLAFEEIDVELRR